jgi:uncharacterized C2H2 Zn-finger protein
MAADKKPNLGPYQVRIFNKNDIPYTEFFHDKLIEIPSGEYVIMQYDEALSFLRRMPPIKLDKNGMIPKKHMKYLQIDPDDKKRAEANLRTDADGKSNKVFVCCRCGDEFESKKALMKHVKKNHESELADKKTANQLDDMLEDDDNE